MTDLADLDFQAPVAAPVEPFSPWPTVTLPDGHPFPLGCRLPSGAEVTFRDPLLLRAGDRNNVIRGLSDGVSEIAAGLDMSAGTIALIVEGWTLDLPHPRDGVHVLDQLTIADYDALVEHTKPVLMLLFPNTSPSSDRTSPTGPSSG